MVQTSRIILALSVLFSTFRALGADLDQTLSDRFHRFDQVRDLFNQYYQSPSPVAIPRSTWEEWIGPDLPPALLKQLAESQRLRIQEAKRLAEQSSKYSLAALRSSPDATAKSQSLCSNMPKGGLLHIHLSGTVKPATAAAILQRSDPLLPLQAILATAAQPSPQQMLYPSEIETLSKLPQDRSYRQLSSAEQQTFLNFFLMPSGPQPFERFDTTFEFISTVYPDIATLIDDFATRAAAEHVSYAELRTTFASSELPA